MSDHDHETHGDLDEEMDRDSPAKRPPPVLPLGEVETPETKYGIVAITRQMNMGGGKDDNKWYRFECPVPFQPGWDLDQCAVQAVQYFNMTEAVVCEQAGLSVEMSENGILREVRVREAFPDAEEVKPERRSTAPRRSSAGHRTQQSGRSQIVYPHPADLDQPPDVSDEDWDDLCNNFDDWYDNRASKAQGKVPRGPDFKHKQDGTGIWLARSNSSSRR